MFMIVLIKQEQQAARVRSSQPIINFETFFVLPTDRPTDDRVTDRQNELPTDNDNN